MDVVHMPKDADASTISAMLSHTNTQLALDNPHTTMQEHLECKAGQRLAKSVAYHTLADAGKPRSNGVAG